MTYMKLIMNYPPRKPILNKNPRILEILSTFPESTIPYLITMKNSITLHCSLELRHFYQVFLWVFAFRLYAEKT